jgi:L-alanine-DL-glutamate epimerase-like enolase superfamily enzyme
VTTYDAVAGLPLEIDSYALERLQLEVSSEFTRVTTVVRLSGGGVDGVGEDVTYDPKEQEAFQRSLGDPALPLRGHWESLDDFSEALGALDTFPDGGPARPVSRSYRRWAFESAALDLALRQAGRSLPEALGLEARPLTYVVSMRLGEPASLEPVRARLEYYPGLRFKLDPTPSWTPALVEELAATGAVATLDLKGAYRGTPVDNPPDASLYRLVAEGFPGAWIEDPDLTSPEADAALAPFRERITWDAIFCSVADAEALPFPPRMLNVKPSRFGSLRELLAAYDYCAANGIGVYGGGQFELGPGRGQIEYLASMFGPEHPNDVAPVGFHASQARPGLEPSPLAPSIDATGFRWG